ncbi:MAG: Trp family transcriptional regulator [bacterium]
MKKNDASIYTLLLKSKTSKETQEILELVLGTRELDLIEKRYLILKLLSEKKSYVEIMKEVKTSTATIAKVSSSIKKETFKKYFNS